MPSYFKRFIISYKGGNHLSTDRSLSFPSFISEEKGAPTIIWVSRSWGLPRSTLFISEETTSLWHFYRYSCHILLGLRQFPSRQSSRLPWLIVSPSTNTTSISACASMDFPLQISIHSFAAITRTLSS